MSGSFFEDIVGDAVDEHETKHWHKIAGAAFLAYFVYDLMGIHWFWNQAMSAEWLGGAEWWLMLWILCMWIPWAMATHGFTGMALDKRKISRDEHRNFTANIGYLAPILSLWGALWTYCLPHTWGLAPYDAWWKFLILLPVLVPFGWGPMLLVKSNLNPMIADITKRLEAGELAPLEVGESAEGMEQNLQEMLSAVAAGEPLPEPSGADAFASILAGLDTGE